MSAASAGLRRGGRSAALWWFVLRRLLVAVPLILSVIVVNFTLIHLAPGDPVSLMVGEFAPSQDQLQELTAKMGLDQPLYIQLARYIGLVVRGDLGYSFVSQTPVIELIAQRIPATVELVLTSLVIFSSLGVGLGILAARRPHSAADNASAVLNIVGYSVPVFWLGQLALLVFALRLHWLPAQGMYDVRGTHEGLDGLLDRLLHLLLPATVLGMRYLAINARLSRASMIEALGQDYIVAAHAKGLRERTVTFHAFRNAILPLVTVLGVNLGDILTGSVLTEIVFGWPGLGQLMYDATFSRDYPLLMGLFVVISVGIIVTNLVVDLVYGLIDPRVRPQ